LEINWHGFVRDRYSGRMITPRTKNYRPIYDVGGAGTDWPISVPLGELLGSVWDRVGVKLGQRDAISLRVTANQINKRMGFGSGKGNGDGGGGGSDGVDDGGGNGDDYQPVTDNDQDRRPCPDGRSPECYSYLPSGYHARCPACWKSVRDGPGYGWFDFSGRMTWDD
jgi:hypothetical protein